MQAIEASCWEKKSSEYVFQIWRKKKTAPHEKDEGENGKD